ncbi:hypothetical protein Poli38472_000703 [Pythium oligandrum]|uniref:Uncharacterized protein n=1 Tax=Pythium oligandrum TaxID=41045 RepID=A0A8K1FFK8_PYTOL|nr:hypothetical protein Poli38472_000703 [Pythium oligandrum]|eukprot:TMW60661.1 hypothetical protein Poli38472_000703 [Pythium oligandrum]
MTSRAHKGTDCKPESTEANGSIEFEADFEPDDLPDSPFVSEIESVGTIAPSQRPSIGFDSDAASGHIISQPPGISTNSNGADGGASAKKKKKASSQEPSEVDATANLIQELVVSDRSDTLDNKVVQLEDALNTLMQRASVSRQQREASAAVALKIVDEIESVMQRAPMLRKVTASSTLDTELLSAARAVFLLVKYSRQLVDNVSHLNSLTRELTNVEKLNRKAGSCDNVETSHLFLIFAICVATALHICGHKSRAEDIFRLTEKRLLQIQHRGDLFRSVVEEYVGVRKMLNVTPALGSTHEAQLHFEWYASDHGFGGGARCQKLIKDSVSHGRDAFFFDEFVFTGADTKEQISQFMAAVFQATHTTGLKVNMKESSFNMSELPLFNFMFSAIGIVPNNHSNCRYCTH